MSGETAPSAILGDDPQAVVAAKSIAGAREMLAVVLWTIFADIVVFRALGFAGPAIFFATVVPLFYLARGRQLSRSVIWGSGMLLFLVAARLAWCGTALNIFSGIILVLAVAMAASGAFPFVLECMALGLSSIVYGMGRVISYRMPHRADGQPMVSFPASAVFLPVLTSLVFGAIFTLANPNLRELVSQRMSIAGDFVWSYFRELSAWEIPFCMVAFLVGAGLMMPKATHYLFGPSSEWRSGTIPGFRSTLYAAYRNTVVTLIVLFAVYLCFEFVTLWHRDFPDGFYYAGYAHQGAAWLTVALALATLILSWIFSGETLLDERHVSLKRLAWVWSAANFLLAIAVYNRLLIYVGYNGMTQMRTVGFFGITLVVVGFLLVLVKIRYDLGFWWLIRSQLIALVLTFIAYGLFPVDFAAHAYNVRKIASGYLHPSVMVAVKPIDDEGLFPLIALAKQNIEDRTIHEGVLARLAERQVEIEEISRTEPWHWTKFQGATSAAYRSLKANESLWTAYIKNSDERKWAIERFVDYSMKWY